MKKFLVLLLAVLMSLSLFGCGSKEQDPTEETKQVYIIAQSGEPSSMNPDATSDDYFYGIAQNLYGRLYKLNNNYEAIPDLATSYEVSEDALTYTFHLRENAVWSDGEKLTSADVKYTYDTIIAESYANASVFASVESIECPDDYTVVFHFATPDSTFMANVSWYGTFILPKHVLEGQDWLSCDFNENPVTCGPFKFEAWNKGTDVRIVRDDNYWGETKAILDEVIYTIQPDSTTAYQAWLNGEVDEAYDYPFTEFDALKASSDYVWVTQEWPSPYYLTFNMKEGPFSNVLVREALLYGIDREVVNEKAFAGLYKANNYFISQIYTDALNEEYNQESYDPEKAMSLLEQAGYTKDADGFYFSTTLTIFSGFDDAATVVCSELEKIGIKATLNVIDYNVWEEQVWTNQQFEFTMVAGFQGPDVAGCIRRWTKDGTVNVNGYYCDEIEALVVQIKSATSQDEINSCVKKIQEYLRRDITLITMVSYCDITPYKAYIKGHPSYTDEMGGSRSKAGFSELTYTYIEK